MIGTIIGHYTITEKPAIGFLEHPNIASVHEGGELPDGRRW